MSTREAYPAPETSGGPSRARFADAGEAARSVLARAAAASPPLTQREWRVLAAVLQVTTTYSKLSDRVWKTQLGEAAGGLEDKALQRTLRSLHDRHLIVWRPSSVKGRPSIVSVVPSIRGVDASPPMLSVRGADSDPPNLSIGGVDPEPVRGVGADPPPEKYQGETSPPAVEPLLAAALQQEEEEKPCGDDHRSRAAAIVRTVRGRHRGSPILAADLTPLRVAIAGALERGCADEPLADALAAKVHEAAGVGLLVTLARGADPEDHPSGPTPAERERAAQLEREHQAEQLAADLARQRLEAEDAAERRRLAPYRRRQRLALDEARRVGAEFCWLEDQT